MIIPTPSGVDITRPAYVETSSGLILPEALARQRKRPLAVDLFCGAGGMSLGVVNGGFDVVAALDNAPAAAVTFLVNLGAYPCQFHFSDDGARARLETYMDKSFKQKGVATMTTSGSNAHRVLPPGASGVGHFFFGDARKFTGQQILNALGLKQGEIDLVCGGPPCQGFSRANAKRNVMDPRNSLVFDFVRIALEIGPKSIVLENVPEIVNMLTPDGLPVIDVVCRMLEAGDFGVYERLKKSMLASSGAGTMLQGSSVSTQETEPAAQQMSLF